MTYQEWFEAVHACQFGGSDYNGNDLDRFNKYDPTELNNRVEIILYMMNKYIITCRIPDSLKFVGIRNQLIQLLKADGNLRDNSL
jgi:hypothetical protein